MARKVFLKLTAMPVLREDPISPFLSSSNQKYRQTRSGTPITLWPANEDNQNMSSGDESDDEDLTDADSSDSDWSDFAAGECYNTDAFVLTHLRLRVVRFWRFCQNPIKALLPHCKTLCDTFP
jgi:hypothetical protein